MTRPTNTLLAGAATIALLALILHGPALIGHASFSVGLDVQPVAIHFAEYTQPLPATTNETVRQRAPATYYHTTTRPVTHDIEAGFAPATNFTIHEDGQAVVPTRSGDTLAWNATPAANASVTWDSPAPVLALGNTEQAEQYRQELTITAQTPLRNSTYEIDVPTGYKDHQLYETIGGQRILRTNTYSLSVSGGAARFENVYFTQAVLDRALTLEAERKPPRESGGGGGGGPRLSLSFPGELRVQSGEYASADATITYHGATSADLELEERPPIDGLALSPSTAELSPGDELGVTIEYRSPSQEPAQTHDTTIHALLNDDDVEQFSLRVVVERREYDLDLQNPDVQYNESEPEAVRFAGTVRSDEPRSGSLEVFLRDERGTEHGTTRKEFSRTREVSFAETLSLDGPGTYEACARITDASGTVRERCALTTVAPSRPQVELPAPTRPEPSSSSWPTILAALALLAAVGYFGVRKYRAYRRRQLLGELQRAWRSYRRRVGPHVWMVPLAAAPVLLFALYVDAGVTGAAIGAAALSVEKGFWLSLLVGFSLVAALVAEDRSR